MRLIRGLLSFFLIILFVSGCGTVDRGTSSSPDSGKVRPNPWDEKERYHVTVTIRYPGDTPLESLQAALEKELGHRLNRVGYDWEIEPDRFWLVVTHGKWNPTPYENNYAEIYLSTRSWNKTGSVEEHKKALAPYVEAVTTVIYKQLQLRPAMVLLLTLFGHRRPT